MTAPPTPDNFQSSPNTNSVSLDWDYDNIWFGFDGDDSTFLGFDDGLWLHPDNGIKVYYREKGATTWNKFSEVSIDAESEAISSLNSDTTYEFKIRVYTANEYSETSTIEATTFLDSSRSVTSYASPASSSAITVIDLNEPVNSHSRASNSSSSRMVDLLRDTLSQSDIITSESERVASYIRNADVSYSKSISSFTYNERTSLELIDHTIEWDDGSAVWYTNWFSETRILGTEDSLAIRSLVVEDAKEPTAQVIVQYDAEGDGVVDQESERINLGREEEIKEISGVPVDEDGFYRIKIMEYSGYNSIFSLDTAIVH